MQQKSKIQVGTEKSTKERSLFAQTESLASKKIWREQRTSQTTQLQVKKLESERSAIRGFGHIITALTHFGHIFIVHTNETIDTLYRRRTISRFAPSTRLNNHEVCPRRLWSRLGFRLCPYVFHAPIQFAGAKIFEQSSNGS